MLSIIVAIAKNNAIGKDNKTVIGIKDKNLADAIKKILDGGDVIG